jgi:hypothetical protein
MELKESDTLKDILLKLQDKEVYILLKSGKEYLGIIKKVGALLTILEQKGKRSFFDSIIRNDDISAVEIKVREK